MKNNLRVVGKIIKGLGQAKKLGFPTLNLSPRAAPRALKPGIYAVRVSSKAGNFFGVVYFGPRFEAPNVRRATRVFEVHLLDAPKMPKIQRLKAEFVKRLRAPKKFANVSVLKRQISRDIARAKRILIAASI